MDYIKIIQNISNEIKENFNFRYNLRFFDSEDCNFKGRHIYFFNRCREYIFINSYEHTWFEQWLKPINILEDFINTLIHEVGHHLDYTNNIIKSKNEYFAQCFSSYVKGKPISKSMKKTIDKYIDIQKLRKIINKYMEV